MCLLAPSPGGESTDGYCDESITSPSVAPLRTDSGCSPTTSEPGRAALVPALEQQPLRLLALAARALQREPAAQLLPVQHEHGVARVRAPPARPPARPARRRRDPTRSRRRARSAPRSRCARCRGPRPATASRFTAGSIEGPFGTAHERIAPSTSQPQVEVVRARLVLLHDEHAGADAADRELLVPLDATSSTSTSRTSRAARPLRRNATSSSTAPGSPSAWTATVAVVFVAHPARARRACAPAAASTRESRRPGRPAHAARTARAHSGALSRRPRASSSRPRALRASARPTNARAGSAASARGS